MAHLMELIDADDRASTHADSATLVVLSADEFDALLARAGQRRWQPDASWPRAGAQVDAGPAGFALSGDLGPGEPTAA